MERTREIVQEDNGIALLSFSVGALRFAVEAIHIRSISDPDRSRETTAPALADRSDRHPPVPPPSARCARGDRASVCCT